MTLAQHSKKSVEWGTPEPIVAMARTVMGGVDFDPCSSTYWNLQICASAFMDENGFHSGSWPRNSRVFCNPPGGLVKEFWRACRRYHESGGTVFWVGFSLEQLAYLQEEGALDDQYFKCIPRKRLAYLTPQESGPPVAGKSPTHSSYLLLMPKVEQQVDRFRDCAAMLGATVW